MNERLILMIKRLFRDLGSRQRPGVRRSSGASERLVACGKLQRAGALQNALALMSIAALMIAVRPIQAQWEQLPPMPEPNGGFVCGQMIHDLAVAGGSKWQMHDLMIAGGTNWEGGKKNWLTSFWVFDTNGKAWRRQDNLEKPVAYAMPVQISNILGFIGGTDGSQVVKDFVLFDGLEPLKRSVPELPSTMVLAAGGAFEGGLFVFAGGTDDAANLAGVTRATHSLVKGNVTRLADYPGKPFATAASAVAGNELFVFGGMNYDAEAKLPANTAEAYAFSPDKNVWRKLTPLAAPTRGLTAVTLDESHIYIAGGYREDFTAEAVVYDVKADSYRKALSLPYAAMVGLVRMGDHVYCLGGEDKKQSRTDKFFRIPVAELLK
jgi:N-acetylneuraminic acid mutarotase